MRGRVARRTVARVVTAMRGATAIYVVVQHQFKDPRTAFARGEKRIKNEGAPAGVRGLQFYPSTDGSAATCL
jgi:hypothetical protein